MDQTISQYFYDNSWHFTLNFFTEHWDVLVDILLYPLGLENSDKMIWRLSPLGSVTAKTSYSQLRRKHPKVNWGSWIWSSFVPPRKSITFWRAINDKLPTWDKLHFRGLCPLCRKAEEIVDHIFVICDFAQQLWQKVQSAFNISLMIPSSFGEFRLSAMNVVLSPQLLLLWRFVFVNCIWSIWNSRNKFIFDNVRPSVWHSTSAL